MPLELKITAYKYSKYNKLGYLKPLKATDDYHQHEKLHTGL